jgi:hypothetical protein
MNPLSTGSEMKFEKKPRRSTPATSAAMPVVIASATVSATNFSLPCVASSIAADNAAVADIGPTTRWRELPKAA